MTSVEDSYMKRSEQSEQVFTVKAFFGVFFFESFHFERKEQARIGRRIKIK